MLVSLFRWMKGYLLVAILGYSPERFFNLCSNHHIAIWGLSKTEEAFMFRISIKDFFRLRPIVRKTKTRPIVRKRYGLPLLFHRYKKRKIFFLSLLLGVILVYYMSLYIWDVQITGQELYTEESIIEFLKSEGVYPGTKKSKIDCTEIEETLRKKYVDVGWVSAEIRGTRLLIKITETNLPKPYIAPTGPCHIVADQDGIVLRIITRTGTPKVSIGDVVRKGQIMVSGIVEILGDDQTVVKRGAVIADADIYIKTYYNYNYKVNLTYYDKVYTDRSSRYYSLFFFGHNFYLLNPFKDYDKYDYYEHLVSEKDLRLNENYYLPLKWSTITNKEYDLVKKQYTQEEATKLAEEALNLYIRKLEEQDVTILENNVEFTLMDQELVASGQLIVEQKIRSTVPISEEEIAPPEESENSSGE